MSDDSNPTVRVIRRYTNRKLYDTLESRYVTLEEISAMVKAGQEVAIQDNRTGEDLTEVTLAQILFEEQKQQKTHISLGALKEMIRTSGATLSDFFQRRVKDQVQSLKEGAERKVDEIVRRSESTVEEKARVVREFFSNTNRSLDDLQRKLDERLHTLLDAMGGRSGIRKELQTLRQRIEELENRLKGD
jgi:polyhydroxyalkanoate synthesis repressor PhaR